jgi:hypothetical protein
MAPPPNSFICISRAITYVKKQRKLLGSGAITDVETDVLCFSRAITYVKKQRKLLGSGAITDGETDAKNASVDGTLTGIL